MKNVYLLYNFIGKINHFNIYDDFIRIIRHYLSMEDEVIKKLKSGNQRKKVDEKCFIFRRFRSEISISLLKGLVRIFYRIKIEKLEDSIFIS